MKLSDAGQAASAGISRPPLLSRLVLARRARWRGNPCARSSLTSSSAWPGSRMAPTKSAPSSRSSNRPGRPGLARSAAEITFDEVVATGRIQSDLRALGYAAMKPAAGASSASRSRRLRRRLLVPADGPAQAHLPTNGRAPASMASRSLRRDLPRAARIRGSGGYVLIPSLLFVGAVILRRHRIWPRAASLPGGAGGCADRSRSS